MLALMRMPTYSNSAEYADNRISLFSAQWGNVQVTGDESLTSEKFTATISCHGISAETILMEISF